jgi:hypothetical protein
MSHVAYDLQLADAMNDLADQVKQEKLPQSLDERNEPTINEWQDEEIFHYLAALYIKYIDIYRKLEAGYDQIVHPQKRLFIKKVLECTISRICDIKKDLVAHNICRPKSIYVHFDQLLFDLRYDPSVIELPVPRYFREDDRIAVDVAFKTRIVRDADGKKKKGGAKKKKKKGKKGEDEEVKKDPSMPLPMKQALVSKMMVEFGKYQNNEPEVEKMLEPMLLSIDILPAIMLLQKTDRGRQGKNRLAYMQLCQKQALVEAEVQQRRNLG